MARIRLSILVNLGISVVTFAISGSSVALGSGISIFLPYHIAKYASALILCLIGLYLIAPALRLRSGGQKIASSDASRRIVSNPLNADSDNSRHIGFKGNTLLGIALSINNIGSGMRAGLPISHD